jgi:inosine triphosphate pyrophosphatase
MKDLVFITGNQHKADHLARWLGIPVKHHKLDLDEIQSLDLKEVVEHKVSQAYGLMKCPVLVEDVSLEFAAMGRLPGTLVKWFLEELGTDGIGRLIGHLDNRRARATIMYALFDGKKMMLFDAEIHGEVVSKPRGGGMFDFGWNSLFIPEGSAKTYGEMDEAEFEPLSHRIKAIKKLKAYLDSSEA